MSTQILTVIDKEIGDLFIAYNILQTLENTNKGDSPISKLLLSNYLYIIQHNYISERNNIIKIVKVLEVQK